jgi:hypothetical protein
MGAPEPPSDPPATDSDASDVGAVPDENGSRRWSFAGVLKVASAGTAIAVAIVAILSLEQANQLQEENNHLQQSGLNSRLEEAMVGIDQHFVTHARLRPFFFTPTENGPRMPPAKTRLSYETMATAELIVDFADDVASYLRTDMMEGRDAKRWASIVRPYFDQSRMTRLEWKEDYKAYDKVTACVLGAPQPEKMSGWDWEHNTPKASWPSPCTKDS